MKTLLLLPAFVLGSGCYIHAQTTAIPAARQEISQDSLNAVYREIDKLDVFELKKLRESYVFKCRTEPSATNKAILAYVEQRKREVE